MSKLKVVELFAGVGDSELDPRKLGIMNCKGNQWEPPLKLNMLQWFMHIWGSENHSNDIYNVKQVKFQIVMFWLKPLVGLFCSNNFKNSKVRVKGVLWWQINRILEEKKNPNI